MTIYSPIGVDLGADYTGIIFYHNSAGKVSDCRAAILTIDHTNFRTCQAERRQKRHLRRNIKRKRLARRLLYDIIRHLGADLNAPLPNLVPQVSLASYLSSLLKRRGYTYLTLDEKLNDLDFQTGNLILCYLISTQAVSLHPHERPSTFADLLAVLAAHNDAPERLANLKAALDQLTSDKDKLDTLALESRDLAPFKNAVGAYLDALNKDRRNRQRYLAYLEHELAIRAPLPGVPLSPTQLYHLIGNIANMQQRDLRHYFDGVFPDTPFNSQKLYQAIRRSVNLRHIASLAPNDGLACLLQADPATTTPGFSDDHIIVPQFESQNNRRPPQCPAIRLNSSHPTFSSLSSPAIPTFIHHLYSALYPNTELNQIKIKPLDALQAFFDMNDERGLGLREYFTKYPDASPETAHHDLSTNPRFPAFLQACSASGIPPHTILAAAKAYALALKDVSELGFAPPSSPVRVCTTHAPLKRNLLSCLVASLLQRPTLDVPALKRRIENARLLSALRRVAEAYQTYRSGISALLDPDAHLTPDLAKTSKTLLNDIARLASLLDEFVAPHDGAPRDLHRDPYVLTQLYFLIFEDTAGFASNCRDCALANHHRKLLGIRPLPRSPREFHKPLDGMIGRIIDRLAWEIAQRKFEHLRPLISQNPHASLEIPIALEANSFRFSLELASTKRANRNRILKRLKRQSDAAKELVLSKLQRIKDDARGICAYCGSPLSDPEGEIDHIIPRAIELQNAEINLIYVHRRCNQQKRKAIYSITNIATHFRAAYNLADDTVLRNELTTLANRLRSTTAALDVLKSSRERTLCRLALFHPDFRDEFRALLPGRRIATVNGTQRYLKARLIEKLSLLLDQAGHSGPRSFPAYEIPAELVASYRSALSTSCPYLPPKNDSATQSAFSHILDAALVAFASDPYYAGDVIADLPSSLDVVTISSRPKYLRLHDSPESVSHFKDTFYAERFVPLLLTRGGQLLIGFNAKNAIALPNHTLIHVLFPLLATPKDCSSPDAFLTYLHQRLQTSSAPHIAITIDRKKYADACYQRSHSSIPQETNTALTAAECLRFYTIKTPVLDGNEPRALNEEKFAIKIQIPAKLAGTKKAVNGPVIHPAFSEWQRFYKHYEATHDVPSFFLTPNRTVPPYHHNHERQRQIFSLPVLQNPSGGVRLYRHGVVQVVAQDDALRAGLNPSGDSSPLLPHYARSRRLVPVDHTPSNTPVLPVGTKAPIPIPPDFPHIRAAFAVVGTDSGRLDYTLEIDRTAMQSLLGFDPFYLAPPEFKITDKSRWQPKLIPPSIPFPRNGKISILTLSTSTVRFTFTSQKSQEALSALRSLLPPHPRPS